MIRPAATALLLRETDGELEVLMLRRGAGLAFMAGLWVFPGGRVDAADSSAAAAARVLPGVLPGRRGLLCDMRGAPLADEDSLALHVAACRETFEEAGVLLACDARGRPCEPGRVAELQVLRAAIDQDAGRFVTMLEAEDLYLDIEPLVYWSHWITPSVEPKRYDTRFFAVAAPPAQAVSADLSELTDCAWIRPAGVAAAIECGSISVAPPTLLTLEDLAERHRRHGRVASLLAAERGRPVPPVLPRVGAAADCVSVIMPWDADYAATPGDGCTPSEGFPEHLLARISRLRLPPRVSAGPQSEGPGHSVPGPRNPAA